MRGGDPSARVGLRVKFRREIVSQPWTYGIIESLSVAGPDGRGERRDLIRTGRDTVVRVAQAKFYEDRREFGLGWVPITDDESSVMESFYSDLQGPTAGKRRTKRRKYNNELRTRHSNKKKGRRSRK